MKCSFLILLGITLLNNHIIYSNPVDIKELNPCSFTKINTCQDKHSGGHQNTIRSTTDGYCAKLVRKSSNSHEYKFYQSVGEKFPEMTPFLPGSGKLCRHKKKIYFLMNHLKKGLAHPWELDVKIGTKTVCKRDLKNLGYNCFGMATKKFKHKMIDKHFSTSSKIGYRVAGVSSEKQISYSKMLGNCYRSLYPNYYIKSYFQTDSTHSTQLQCFIDKLEKLEEVTHNDGFNNLRLIGTSLLFIYDKENPQSNECRLSMIDFAHSSYNAKHPSKKHPKEFKRGLTHIIADLKRLLNKKLQDENS